MPLCQWPFSHRQRVNAILRKTNAARMADGIEIRIRGQVTYYPRQGRVQLIMSLIDPAYTLGQLEAAKTALMAELASEGLVEAKQMLWSVPFPPLPLRVGLVTSSGSAAEADFLKELQDSSYPFEVTLFDSRVQGEEAVGELVAAIDAATEYEIDVIAIVRGGGARTDLAAFDHGDVARAIAASPKPVVVGVGHEIDRSVVDQVAADAAKTPTACAAGLVARMMAFDRRVERCRQRIGQVSHTLVRAQQHQVQSAGVRLNRLSTQAIARQSTVLELAQRRLASGAERRLERESHRLATATIRVDALDPRVALARGWSITHDGSGRLVRSAADLPTGTTLITTVADGTVASTVTAIETGSGAMPTEDQ